ETVDHGADLRTVGRREHQGVNQVLARLGRVVDAVGAEEFRLEAVGSGLFMALDQVPLAQYTGVPLPEVDERAGVDTDPLRELPQVEDTPAVDPARPADEATGSRDDGVLVRPGGG